MIQLIIGGARSGKSRFGETEMARFSNLGQSCVYLATATANDDEMRQRILRHQQDRDNICDPQLKIDWQLVEEPLFVAETLAAIDKPNQTIFVDCLTLYLTQHLMRDTPSPQDVMTDNCMLQSLSNLSFPSAHYFEPSINWAQQKQRLLQVLVQLKGNVVLVSNEVGSGIVPMGELSRQFVDEAGWLNQAIAQIADDVTLVVAGLPMQLKGNR
ncbi:bifunctional adenosylcobinamide kinase/adenosylcobinamide-phosphate guanylyltransferase [Shewanella intestini]|uniref:Bifunctional adenosylcobalamin biosynthesis protein n=1 Tax=Shewanella intestini TaxID=2017544 RepID=A0ABS5I388_9GAMM|nr:MULTISPECIES: bifunctional adenosylcobinamide kinase/adenosylcobinamide-phosphate guanylyltransferase [Shewanella]MBR9728486.1 bifunctional adenosylcobinamide kinase/adenosylcobinamide-phosphate guanylyltransferase [Shewanella intestini]MRG36305.1 bifunctional adenosylcobinamide kinase/adenosylcobinamide-phosphate guanylyltransferase [Shewanella sp. XMDDZSB0408]